MQLSAAAKCDVLSRLLSPDDVKLGRADPTARRLQPAKRAPHLRPGGDLCDFRLVGDDASNGNGGVLDHLNRVVGRGGVVFCIHGGHSDIVQLGIDE